MTLSTIGWTGGASHGRIVHERGQQFQRHRQWRWVGSKCSSLNCPGHKPGLFYSDIICRLNYKMISHFDGVVRPLAIPRNHHSK